MTLPIVYEPAPRRGLSASALPQSDYARPVGLVYGAAAQAAVAAGEALPLAGGPIAFRSLDLIRREAGVVRVLTVPVDALDPAALPSGTIARLTAPRGPLWGADALAPAIMGIVNVTPDSFSDGGRFASRDAAIAQGRRLAEEGADILDIGGESTRPGAADVSIAQEIDRVVPVIEALAGEGHRISVDTRKAPVMRAALEAGATIVNDVSGLTHDPEAPAFLAGQACPVVLMHMRGEPGTMQADPRYDCAPLDVYDELEARLTAAEAAGISRDRLVVDPGFGFAKTAAHNIQVTAWLTVLHGMGRPVLFGASRKSSIGVLSRGEAADARLPGSLALAGAAMDLGAQTVRVHDVSETAQALALRRAILAAS
ncbi:dihydropteroate synthase [Thalassobaculum sp. OXR-137]|uniref:dihydropteroate synthase n=1 Tax=Thalassobaculum sp. OXR-137 TaxID=3100173 RepID=UPI002AC9667E|nr:dihydropteroate synthase [Thalassobaculum sp. OXR-137]WPZ36925.1 dihydropteroate synthase [Thalassobaculum sp. OXR-137]